MPHRCYTKFILKVYKNNISYIDYNVLYYILSTDNKKKREENMKKLAVYLKDYRKESILAPLFKLLEALFDLLVPIAVAQMIDSGKAGVGKSVYLGFGALILMALVGLACSVTAQYFAAKASIGVAGALRQALFDHIQSLSFSQIDKLGSATLITRLSGDVNQVQNGLNMGLRLLLRSPFIVFGAMIMAFTIDFKSALVFVVTIPVLFAVVFAIMLVSIPLFSKAQSGLDRVTLETRENLTGVRVIRAFCREKESVDEFDASNKALTRLNLFVGRISALMNPLTYVLINIAAVFLIKVSAVQVNSGIIPQGQVVALYNYMLQIIVELIKLASLIITLNKALACAKRTADILETEPDMTYPAESPHSENSVNGAPAVEFKNVTFTYSGAGAPSLSDINFKIAKGENVGVIGGTGSGKSTLISLIPRFYDATKGQVLVDGVPVEKYTKDELTKKVGVVQQKSVLFEGSIRDNLKYGNQDAADEELWNALETAQGKKVVEDKPGQLDFVLEQSGRNLSGGQKQRLSIARTLVKKPEILILDDSSSALDYATDAALRSGVKKLPDNVTTFIVSQRIACVRDSDVILVLDNGELSAVGSHDELLKTSEVYRGIYYSQFPEENPENKAKEAR